MRDQHCPLPPLPVPVLSFTLDARALRLTTQTCNQSSTWPSYSISLPLKSLPAFCLSLLLGRHQHVWPKRSGSAALLPLWTA